MAKKVVFGDAMAFFGLPGQPPKVTTDMEIDVAHVTCAPPWAKTTDEILDAARVFKSALLASEKQVICATNRADLDQAIEKGFTACVLGLQNLPTEPHRLHSLCNAGIRVVSLAYDGVSPYGSGCMNLDVGLSFVGEEMLHEIDSYYGFILDLSRASHRMAREVLAYIDEKNLSIPVMASHTGCYAVYPHFCNLPDDVLQSIAKRGGIIGIPTLGFILGKDDGNDELHFREHLRHAIELCGINAIAIGSDGPYINIDPEQGINHFEMMRSKIDPHGTWGARWPEHPFPLTGPDKMLALAVQLEELGIVELPPERFETVMGGNLLRFFRDNLPK